MELYPISVCSLIIMELYPSLVFTHHSATIFHLFSSPTIMEIYPLCSILLPSQYHTQSLLSSYHSRNHAYCLLPLYLPGYHPPSLRSQWFWLFFPPSALFLSHPKYTPSLLSSYRYGTIPPPFCPPIVMELYPLPSVLLSLWNYTPSLLSSYRYGTIPPPFCPPIVMELYPLPSVLLSLWNYTPS